MRRSLYHAHMDYVGITSRAAREARRSEQDQFMQNLKLSPPTNDLPHLFPDLLSGLQLSVKVRPCTSLTCVHTFELCHSLAG